MSEKNKPQGENKPQQPVAPKPGDAANLLI